MSDGMPNVRCGECKVPYEPRVNMLDGKTMLFPTCKHGPEHHELVPEPVQAEAVKVADDLFDRAFGRKPSR